MTPDLVELIEYEPRETWRAFRLLAGEFRDLGDRVLVLGRQEARGRGGGVQVDTPWGVFTIFAAAKSRVAVPISITERHCGQRASRSRRRRHKAI